MLSACELLEGRGGKGKSITKILVGKREEWPRGQGFKGTIAMKKGSWGRISRSEGVKKGDDMIE